MKEQPTANRIHVLYLPRWYPNRYDPMPGLFIERHGLSVMKHCDISVLYVHADQQLNHKTYDIVESEDGLFTVRIYFKKSASGLKPYDNLVNLYRFFKSHHKGFKIIRKNRRKEDIVHVHVLTRLGVIAWYNQLRYRIPYVITEHWTRYLASSNSYKGALRKWCTQKVVKHASAVMPVTANLGDAMMGNKLINENYIIVPNVVDTDRFIPANPLKKREKKRIVHVSCFTDDHKNISGILRVVKRLSEVRDDFECILIGDGEDMVMLQDYAKELDLTGKYIHFAGLKENDDLVKTMNDADFMIMFSNRENLPVVILESYSCGVPVISTRVGGIHEHLDDNLGRLVEPKNEDEFFITINETLDNPNVYNSEKIRKYAIDHFSQEVIGASLFTIYKDVLKS
jgi:glycosyltransferase involved in cell wall biosynthesis